MCLTWKPLIEKCHCVVPSSMMKMYSPEHPGTDWQKTGR